MQPITENQFNPSWGESTSPPAKKDFYNKIDQLATHIIKAFSLALITSSLSYIALSLIGKVIVISVPITAAIIVTIAAASVIFYLIQQQKKAINIDSKLISNNLESEIPKNDSNKSFKADLIVYNSGSESWQMKKNLICSATQSIECSFNFAGGAYFREFLQICDQRLTDNPNLKVHLMLESILVEKEDKKLLAEIQKKFPNRFFYLIAQKQSSSHTIHGTEENHAKLLIVDGKYFVIGSSGVEEGYCAPPLDGTEDVGPHRSKPAARSEESDIAGTSKEDKIAYLMRYEFFRLYSLWKKRLELPFASNEGTYFQVKPEIANCAAFDDHSRIHRNQSVKFLVGGPENRDNNAIENKYVSMISSAKKTIHIANLAFYPMAKVKTALEENKSAYKVGFFEGGGPFTVSATYISKRGIHVQNRKDYHYLDEVYEWKHPLSLYHRKVMVIDGTHSIVGSFNLGKKSAIHDYECALVIEDSKEVAEELLKEIITPRQPHHLERRKERKIGLLANAASYAYQTTISPVMG